MLNNKEDILVSLELVKLKNDIELETKIADIHTYSSIDKNENLSIFLFNQGFKSIAERLKNNSFIKTNTSEQKNEKKFTKEYHLIDNVKDLNKLITLVKKFGYVAIDVETSSLNIEKAILVGVSIAVEENSAYYIPINHKNLDSGKKIIKTN